MTDAIVVKRYSEAFLAYCRQTIGEERAFNDVRNLKAIIRENPGFLEFLESQEITFHEKRDFIRKVLNDDFSSQIKQFLLLLLEKGRFAKLGEILEYIRIHYFLGVETEAVIKTSLPLDVDLIQAIERKVEEKFARKFKFYIDLDADLLGGVQVVIGNTVIDGSVRRRLDDLREKLMKVRVP